MTQRSASSFGPAGGATARWQGVESKICLSTLSGSPLAARGCKKSCRRLRLAREMPPEALGCHDWTSHSRDTPTRGHHTPRFVIKAIQGGFARPLQTLDNPTTSGRERARVCECASRRHVVTSTKRANTRVSVNYVNPVLAIIKHVIRIFVPSILFEGEGFFFHLRRSFLNSNTLNSSEVQQPKLPFRCAQFPGHPGSDKHTRACTIGLSVFFNKMVFHKSVPPTCCLKFRTQ